MPRRATPELQVAVTEFLADHRKRAKDAAIKDYRSLLHRFTDAIGPTKKIGNIQPEQVSEWIYDFILAGLAPGTANKYRQRIMVFNRWCRDRKYTRFDWLVDLPAEPEPTRDWVQLSPSQLLNLLSVTDHPRDRILLAIAMNTGLRISEIVSLRVRDVDLHNDRLRVRVRKQRTRTESIDYMPITADLRSELVRWFTAYQAEVGPLTDDWYLAPAKHRDYINAGGPPHRATGTNPGHLKPTTMIHQSQPILRRIFERAGYDVPPGEAWHVLRRSIALIYFHACMESGDPYAGALRRTSALLHHKSGQTTERYLGLNADREARDSDLAGQAFLTRLSSTASERRSRLRVVR